MKIQVLLMELINILAYMDKDKKRLGLDELGDNQVICQDMNQWGRNDAHSPLYVSLLVNDLLLHNYMLDSGASSNVMALKVKIS